MSGCADMLREEFKPSFDLNVLLGSEKEKKEMVNSEASVEHRNT